MNISEQEIWVRSFPGPFPPAFSVALWGTAQPQDLGKQWGPCQLQQCHPFLLRQHHASCYSTDEAEGTMLSKVSQREVDYIVRVQIPGKGPKATEMRTSLQN